MLVMLVSTTMTNIQCLNNVITAKLKYDVLQSIKTLNSVTHHLQKKVLG